VNLYLDNLEMLWQLGTSAVSPVEANALAFNPAFLKKVTELELSLRPATCLDNANIVYIGDLVQMTEAGLLRVPNFGRNSLNEIKEVLVRQLGLHLGMEVPGWPPENIEQLSKRLEASP
jgi:DNA-directed RNA polymerase subunit alpha